MELSIGKQTIELERLIGTKQLQTQVTAETATPGAGREAIEVLMEEADLTIEAAEAQTDRVVVDGVIRCQAVYRQGENTAARAVTATTRISEVIDIPGVTAKSIVRVQGAVENVSAGYENGRMRFEIALDLAAQALELLPIDVINQLSGAQGMEVKYSEIHSSKLAAESTEDAVVREEVALPDQLDARVSLMDWSEVRLTSVSPDLGGVRVGGEIQAEALIGTGVSARPVALVKVMMPFEALCELPEWLTGSVTTEATVKALDTQVVPADQDEGAVLKLEAAVQVRVRADAEDRVEALADAYATGESAIACKIVTMNCATGTQKIECSEPFRGTLLLPSGAPGVGTVLATRVRPVVSQWTSESDATIVEGALDIKALYLPSGSEQMQSARGELPFSMKCDGTWPEDAWVRVSASGAEATALMSDRLEVRATLMASGFYRDMARLELASEAEAFDAPPRRDGLVIHWPTLEESAWTVGKRYQLPQQRVIAVNGGHEALKPGAPIVLML
ncbi:MAG: DUF3794 domain-containing protein [Clostridia bacterium]